MRHIHYKVIWQQWIWVFRRIKTLWLTVFDFYMSKLLIISLLHLFFILFVLFFWFYLDYHSIVFQAFGFLHVFDFSNVPHRCLVLSSLQVFQCSFPSVPVLCVPLRQCFFFRFLVFVFLLPWFNFFSHNLDTFTWCNFHFLCIRLCFR